MNASLLATQMLHGLVYGMLLFLVASGLTLVFGMMRILNMAHASFYMLGAYVAVSVVTSSGSFLLALVIAPLVVGTLGALTERFLLRYVGERGHVADLLLTFGLFFMIGEAVLWIWGSFPLQLPTPTALAGSVPLLGGQYPVYRLFILAFSVVVCVAPAPLWQLSPGQSRRPSSRPTRRWRRRSSSMRSSSSSSVASALCSAPLSPPCCWASCKRSAFSSFLI
jgi:branched-subunit amino acid ABC-type transport system permease component